MFECLSFFCRLLPAVAGDWFYSKINEKFKHEMTGTYGSEVVRSSIRRLPPPSGEQRDKYTSLSQQESNGALPSFAP